MHETRLLSFTKEGDILADVNFGAVKREAPQRFNQGVDDKRPAFTIHGVGTDVNVRRFRLCCRGQSSVRRAGGCSCAHR